MAPAGSKREFDNDFNPYAAPDSRDYADDQEFETGTFEYAGFLRRFVAFFIDNIIIRVLNTAMGVAVGVVFAAINPDQNDPTGVVVAVILSMFLAWLYDAGMISSSYQATLGKMAMGMKVTDLEGKRIGLTRATGRFFARIPSAFILGIGYFMQPFTAKKQALHDMLAGTLVVKSR